MPAKITNGLVSLRFGLAAAAVIFVAAGALKWNSGLMPPISPPNPQPPLKVNARDCYDRAGTLVRDGNLLQSAFEPLAGITHTSPPSVVLTARQAQRLVAENAPALAVVRQGLKLPYRALDFMSGRKITDDDLTALLALQGQRRAAAGDWAGAINADLDCMQFGNSFQHGAPLSSSRHAWLREAAGRRNAWLVVDHLSAPEAKAALARMSQITASSEPYGTILRAQARMFQAQLLYLFAQHDWRQQLSPAGTTPSLSTMLRLSLTSQRRVYQDSSSFQELLIRSAELPWPVLLKSAPETFPNDPLVLASPTFALDAQADHNDFVASNEMLTVELALRAYRLEHSRYPTALMRLVPEYLPSVPLDPFTDNQPLRYRLVSGRPLLYSIGPDAIDDGGRPIPYSHHSWGWDSNYPKLDSKGDLVAGSG